MIAVGTSAENLKTIKAPTTFQWGLEDTSASDAGRVQDENDTMFKNRTSQKRKISLSWTGTTKEETAEILQAFNPEYVFVKYPDAMSGEDEIREFYVGSRSAPLKMWSVNNKYYSTVSFNIIER